MAQWIKPALHMDNDLSPVIPLGYYTLLAMREAPSFWLCPGPVPADVTIEMKSIIFLCVPISLSMLLCLSYTINTFLAIVASNKFHNCEKK